MEGIWNNGTGISFHGNKINSLRCADEIDQFDEQRKEQILYTGKN